MWPRIIWLFIMFLLGKHICFPSSPRYLELADSADYFIQHERWQRAEEKIIEAMRLEPANFSNSLLLANLGLVQSQQAKYEEALQSLTLGLNIAPSSTVLLNNRAHTYLLMDNVDFAIKDLDKSLEIDSIQEWTLQTRAFIYLQENNPEEAALLFNLVKNSFPENPSAYSGLAAIAEYNGSVEEASQLYEKALSLKPDDEEATEAYIFVLIKSGDYTKARSEIRKSIDKNPENPMYYLLRGYLHRLNYRLEEARADKKMAISKGLDPQYVNSFIP